MGRRRKRSSDAEESQKNKGKVEYFFPVTSPSTKPAIRRNNSRILNDEKNGNKVPKEANIKDNVGVTVIMPGGEFELVIPIPFEE